MLAVSILAAAVRSGTPVLFATIGEIFTEKSGNLNLGLEGMILTGAVSGFAVTYYTKSLILGIIAGIIAGGALKRYTCFSYCYPESQSGSKRTCSYHIRNRLKRTFRKEYGRKRYTKLHKAFPVRNPAKYSGNLNDKHYFSGAGYTCIFFLSSYSCCMVLYLQDKSRPGTPLCRRKPENGGFPWNKRFFYPIFIYICGRNVSADLQESTSLLPILLCGVEGMSGGRGWIAIALVIFATWNPFKAALGSYLFGGVEALQLRIQAAGLASIPAPLLKMLPYIFTIIVLLIASRGTARKRLGAPAALGLPYVREERGQ